MRPRSVRRTVTDRAGSGSMRRAHRRHGTTYLALSLARPAMGSAGPTSTLIPNNPPPTSRFVPNKSSRAGFSTSKASPLGMSKSRSARSTEPLTGSSKVPRFSWDHAVDFLAWPQTTTSDDDGRFAIRGVGRSLQAVLTVDDPRFARVRIPVETGLTRPTTATVQHPTPMGGSRCPP